MELSAEQVGLVVDLALAEDISHGDITSRVLIPPELKGEAEILAKGRGVLAGISVARQVFLRVDRTLSFARLFKDGAKIKPGSVLATVSGNVASILKAERVALNFLSRMSGIASETAKYVSRVKGTSAIIKDTRKTTPGIRLLEKYAVVQGGGQNHRLHLGDGVLIKDNHLVVVGTLGMSLADIVSRARRSIPEGQLVEVEVTTVAEAMEAAKGGADIIMLDNMGLDEMRQVVNLVPGKVKLEASGGITRANVGKVARTGVDIISVGALTHSTKALDMSLEFRQQSLELGKELNSP